MKWRATHMLKVSGAAPRRVMLNSGELFTRIEWVEQSTPAYWYDGVSCGWNGTGLPGPHATVAPIKPRGEGTSTTPLKKAVSRITVDARVRRGGKTRRLIVTLLPGDVLSFREEGQRTASAKLLGVLEAYSLATKAAARKLIAERKAARKRARGAR